MHGDLTNSNVDNGICPLVIYHGYVKQRPQYALYPQLEMGSLQDQVPERRKTSRAGVLGFLLFHLDEPLTLQQFFT